MKNLKQYIEEKLIVNKDYKIDNSMTSLIDVLFNNIEDDDTTWEPGEDNIIPSWVFSSSATKNDCGCI